MKNKFILIAAFALVALLAAGLTGAAFWWLTPFAPQAAGTAAAAKAKASKKPLKYVTLDKVIVMLRRSPGEMDAHFISADLVLATTEEKEKLTREHLPLLRSVAVRALSAYPMNAAALMTVQQFADQLNRAFEASYTVSQGEKPFSEVMIGKLIIE